MSNTPAFKADYVNARNLGEKGLRTISDRTFTSGNGGSVNLADVLFEVKELLGYGGIIEETSPRIYA